MKKDEDGPPAREGPGAPESTPHGLRHQLMLMVLVLTPFIMAGLVWWLLSRGP